jgi:hypothetical protein
MIMKKFNLMFGIILTLALITNVYADTQIGIVQTLGTFKQGDCVQLKQICSSCSQNTIISVNYPNSSVALGTVAMNPSGNNSYVYTFCNTTVLGRYIVNGYGDPSGTVEVWAYDFNITTTGNDMPYSIPLFMGLGAFILLIFAFAMKNNYIGFISGTLFLVLGIYMMIFGLGIISDFYTQTLSYISLGIGLLLILASSYSAINETNINLFGIRRGDDDDDF